MNLEMTIRTQSFEIFIDMICVVSIAVMNSKMVQIFIATLLAAEVAIFSLHCKNEAANSIICCHFDHHRSTSTCVITFARAIFSACFVVAYRCGFCTATCAGKCKMTFLRCVNAFAGTILSAFLPACKKSAALLAGIMRTKSPEFFPFPIPTTFRSAKSARSITLHHANFDSAVFTSTSHRTAALVIALPRTKLRNCTMITRQKYYAAVLARLLLSLHGHDFRGGSSSLTQPCTWGRPWPGR